MDDDFHLYLANACLRDVPSICPLNFYVVVLSLHSTMEHKLNYPLTCQHYNEHFVRFQYVISWVVSMYVSTFEAHLRLSTSIV